MASESLSGGAPSTGRTAPGDVDMEDQQCSEDIQPTRGQVNPKEEERTYNIAAGLDDIVEMEAEPTTVSRPAHVSPKEEVHEFIRDDVDEITAEPSPPTRVNPKEELQEFAADEIVEIQSQPVFVSEPVRLRAKEEAQEFTIADDMGLAARVKAEPVLMSLQEDAADEIVEIKSEPVFVSEPVRLRAKEEAQEFTIADGIGMGLAARVKAEPVLMTLQEDDMDMDSESDSGDDDYEEVETFHVLLEMPELEGTPCSLESTPIRLIGLEEDRPIFQLGSWVFEGRHDFVVGANIMLAEHAKTTHPAAPGEPAGAATGLAYSCCVHKKIVFQRVLLQQQHPPRQPAAEAAPEAGA